MSDRFPVDAMCESPLFAGMPHDTRTALLTRGVTRRLEPGATLLSAGQVNHSLFLVADGAVDVHVPGGEDGPHVRLTAGECVGELSVIDGHPASANVIAVTPTTVLEIPHADVWAIIDSNAIFARNLLRVLAGRMRNDDAALAASSDRRRHYERLSMVDALTALNNRRWLDAVFPLHLERLRAEGRRSALLMADVDAFKALNDDLGHAVGDMVLRRIAIALTDALRPDDLLARYGGEEFAVFVADVDDDEALHVAERLRASVAAIHLPDARPCTISVGIAAPLPGEPFEALARRADAALFRAKQGGRNRASR